jgi:hypothetical protein
MNRGPQAGNQSLIEHADDNSNFRIQLPYGESCGHIHQIVICNNQYATSLSDTSLFQQGEITAIPTNHPDTVVAGVRGINATIKDCDRQPRRAQEVENPAPHFSQATQHDGTIHEATLAGSFG